MSGRTLLVMTAVSIALAPLTTPAQGRGPGRDGQRWSFKSKPVARDAAEERALEVLAAMAGKRGMMSVPMDDGRFLRILAESMNARHVVEVGTSQGYSAIWLCLALKKTGGRLTTYEIDKDRAALARENLKRAGVEDTVTLVLGNAHEKLGSVAGPIDMVFLDADKSGYLDYLNQLLPKLRPGGLVVAHNINPRQADPRYVEAITTSGDLETLLVNLQSSGISVSMKKR